MSDIVIKIDSVSKFYKLYSSSADRLKEALSLRGKIYHKDYYTLKNINLEVKKGEILGIVGKNGSGKSTLLKLIAGILNPNKGKVIVNGKISALLELGAGFNPEFTGIQNIYFYGTMLGFTKVEIDEKLGEIVEFADIGDFIYQPIKIYSSGMKSRLGFAVAVHVDPEILILDEVLSVGDSLFKRKCYAKMEEFFKGGKTVIFVSHSAQSIIEICSRAVLLFDSEIILDDTPKKVTDFYQKLLFSNDPNIILNCIGNDKKLIEKENNSTDLCSSGSHGDAEKSSSHYDYALENIKPNIIQDTNEMSVASIKILNRNGKQVNVLTQNEDYHIRIKILFVENGKDNLLFGITIANNIGTRIAGKKLSVIESGSDYCELEAEFNCMFNRDTYSIIFSIKEENYDQDYYLLITDLMIFDVKGAIDEIRWGLLQL